MTKDSAMYKEITIYKAREIIKNRYPIGLFWYKSENGYVGIDNSTGDAWVEEFFTYDECISWLNNKFNQNTPSDERH